VVVEDAAVHGGALTLAARALGGVQVLAVRLQRGRGHQQLELAVLAVVLPQIHAVLVVAAATQEGDARAVRGDLQPHHGGAGQGRTVVDAVDAEFFGHGGGGRAKQCGEQERSGQTHAGRLALGTACD